MGKPSAIVTGNRKGIGLAITKVLLGLGYKVYGISREQDCLFEAESLELISCDISHSGQLQNLYNRILKKDKGLKVLVNNAGVGAIGLHEELDLKYLESMLQTNFIAPILLTRLCLRSLKQNQGYIFNICSTSALKASPLGSAYAATKSGLAHFGTSLFEEIRKTGTKVINIYPDLTKTAFFENLNYEQSEDPMTYLLPEDISQYIEFILQQRTELVSSELTIRTQKHRIDKKK
ncbi:MAG: SDR family oxidoreductase [Spirochaetota bacterium]